MKSLFDFRDKVALVTGAATGMGLATARAFAEAGAAVVLADVREDLVDAETRQLVASGHKAIAVRCDVSDDAQVEAMVDRTVSEFGRLDAASIMLVSWPALCQRQKAPVKSGTESSESTFAAYGAA